MSAASDSRPDDAAPDGDRSDSAAPGTGKLNTAERPADMKRHPRVNQETVASGGHLRRREVTGGKRDPALASLRMQLCLPFDAIPASPSSGQIHQPNERATVPGTDNGTSGCDGGPPVPSAGKAEGER